MHNVSKLLLAGLLSLISYSTMAAPVLSFNNSGSNISQSYTLGDSIDLELWISGLQNADLGGFDIDLTFDGSITQFDLFTWSPAITNSALFNATPGSHSLGLDWVTFEFDLSAQTDAFKLGNLSFTAAALGSSHVEIDQFLLSDAWGQALSADSYRADITVQSNPSPAPVPEPGTFSLFSLGVIGLLYGRRKWMQLGSLHC